MTSSLLSLLRGHRSQLYASKTKRGNPIFATDWTAVNSLNEKLKHIPTG